MVFVSSAVILTIFGSSLVIVLFFCSTVVLIFCWLFFYSSVEGIDGFSEIGASD